MTSHAARHHFFPFIKEVVQGACAIYSLVSDSPAALWLSLASEWLSNTDLKLVMRIHVRSGSTTAETNLEETVKTNAWQKHVP